MMELESELLLSIVLVVLVRLVRNKLQVALLWPRDRATAYVRNVHCAVIGTASGSVQGDTQRQE